MDNFYPTRNVFSPQAREKLFQERPVVANAFPINSVHIDWDRLIAKRPYVLETVDEMPAYLLKPEVVKLLNNEHNPQQRLILDLMWTVGGRVSEVLSLTPASFSNDGYDVLVRLKTLKQGAGRPSKRAQARSKVRHIPLKDPILLDRIQTHIRAGRFRSTERIFPITRQTVNNRINRLVESLGGAPFSVHSHTFRHSFAIHLLLHGRPLKYISQLLGHSSVQCTEIYTNVLISDASHFLEGVDFH
ncbi:tyrosine-type recombinase/integrase [Halioglobus pacificus]|uniref:Resolvase n=1 Tax=Parahalioglobus pacificus TaxID=930806 RepID=A0A919CJX6_9GAMM|nr:site-specific integrase [Halioglobus pacificus]GHD29521.1 resolvase [Halioglobus pacificus]